MKKNHGFPYKWGIKMRYVLLVIQVALFLPQWGHASNNVLLPGPKISFSMKDALMKDVIWELEKRSGFVFAYNANDLLKAGKVNVEVKDKDVYEALDICLKGTGLTYVVQHDINHVISRILHLPGFHSHESKNQHGLLHIRDRDAITSVLVGNHTHCRVF